MTLLDYEKSFQPQKSGRAKNRPCPQGLKSGRPLPALPNRLRRPWWVSREHSFTCVSTTNQAERRSSAAHLLAIGGSTKGRQLGGHVKKEVVRPYSRHPLQARTPFNLSVMTCHSLERTHFVYRLVLSLSEDSPAPLTNLRVSLLSNLPLNLKRQRSFSTFVTNNLILILSQPGFLRNVLQSSFPI